MGQIGIHLGADVLAAVDDLNRLLPELGHRYTAIVIVEALGLHVASALKLLQQRGVCTSAQAKTLLEHMAAIATPSH